MTAHIVYKNIDQEHPVSVSPQAIVQTIRKDIGFDGILIGDDLDMKALDSYGSAAEKAVESLNAGCDLALYCAGEVEKMEELAENLPKISEKMLKRLQNVGFLGESAA